eukprot:5349321-Pleurochrysis_carterae.AAC.3
MRMRRWVSPSPARWTLWAVNLRRCRSWNLTRSSKTRFLFSNDGRMAGASPCTQVFPSQVKFMRIVKRHSMKHGNFVLLYLNAVDCGDAVGR